MILGLKISTKISTRTLDVTSAPVFKIGDMTKAQPLTKKDLASLRPLLEQQRQNWNGQLTPLLKLRTPDAELKKSQINGEMEKINLAEGQLSALNDMVTALSGSGRIHFRVYYDTGEGQIDLLVTDPNPPAAEPAKK